MTSKDVLLTAPEAMKYLKVSKVTLYRLMKGKKLPCYKIGRRYRYRKSELDAWINKQEVK